MTIQVESLLMLALYALLAGFCFTAGVVRWRPGLVRAEAERVMQP